MGNYSDVVDYQFGDVVFTIYGKYYIVYVDVPPFNNIDPLNTAYWSLYSHATGDQGAQGPRGPVGGAIGVSTSIDRWEYGGETFDIVFSSGYLQSVSPG
jgi:hypothetical protein